MAVPAVNGNAPPAPVKVKVPKKSKRRRRTERTLKTIWLVGHLGTIVGTLLEVLSYLLFFKNSVWSVRLYHVTFIFAFVSYTISVVKKMNGQIPSIWTLLPIDNVQYGMVAFFWIFYPRRIIKMVPFVIFSTLQTSEFIISKVFKGEQEIEMKNLINQHHIKMAEIAAYANIAILISLVFDVLRFRQGSVLSLLFFGFFYRIRVAYSPVTSRVISDIMEKLDSFVVGEKSKIPPKYQEKWTHIKWVLEHSEKSQLVRDKNAPPPKPRAPRKVYGGKDSNLWLD